MSKFFSTSDWMLKAKLKSMHLTIYYCRHVLNTSFKHFMYWTGFSPEAQCCCSWSRVEWNECSQGSDPESLDVSTHSISWNAFWKPVKNMSAFPMSMYTHLHKIPSSLPSARLKSSGTKKVHWAPVNNFRHSPADQFPSYRLYFIVSIYLAGSFGSFRNSVHKGI